MSKCHIVGNHIRGSIYHTCHWVHAFIASTVNPVLNGHSKIDKTKVLKTDGSLVQVESIAECSLCSILQYFRPSLSDYPSRKPFFSLILSGRLRQVLLYNLWARHDLASVLAETLSLVVYVISKAWETFKFNVSP